MKCLLHNKQNHQPVCGAEYPLPFPVKLERISPAFNSTLTVPDQLLTFLKSHFCVLQRALFLSRSTDRQVATIPASTRRVLRRLIFSEKGTGPSTR